MRILYGYVAVTGRKRILGPMPYLGVVVYYRPQLAQAIYNHNGNYALHASGPATCA